MLCECPPLQQQPQLWGSLLKALMGFLEQQQGAGPFRDEEDDQADEGLSEAAAVYTSAYARLAYAAKAEPDPLPRIQDSRQYLVTQLAGFSQVEPVADSASAH